MALDFHQWLLTESVRLSEQQHGRTRDDEAANALARSTHGSLTDQLAARASTLSIAPAAMADIRRLQRAASGAALVAMVTAGYVGLRIAQSVLNPDGIDRQTDLIALVRLPTLALAGWIVAAGLWALRGGNGGLTGHCVAITVERFAPRCLRSPLAADIARAGVYGLRTLAGQSRLAAATHATWLAYTGAAALTASLQSASWLALPVAAYGLLPRLLLAPAYGFLAIRRSRRMTLAVTLPGYLQLRDRVHAGSAPANQSEAPMATLPRAPRQAQATATGPVLIIAAERSTDDLLAAIPDLSATFAGALDTRAQRRSLARALSDRAHPPPGLLATSSVLRTPDTGTAQILGDVAETANAPLILVLFDRLALAERGGDPQARIADWDRLADGIGADAVVFDHPQPDPAAIAAIRQWTQDAETS